MYECQWERFKKRNNIKPQSFLRWHNTTLREEQLIQNILNNKMYGFIKCTLQIPEEYRKKWNDLNFPVSDI